MVKKVSLVYMFIIFIMAIVPQHHRCTPYRGTAADSYECPRRSIDRCCIWQAAVQL